MRLVAGAAQQRAQRRREEQRHHERCGQGRDQRQRQVLHELPDDAGPEHQRRECRHARRRRRDDRPRHAPCSERVRGLGLHALGHAALGVFGHDDRIVHQHAHGEDQGEQHDDVDRQPGHLQAEDARQERGGNGDADEDRGAPAQHHQHDDEDQQDRRDHAVLQLVQHVADGGRLVLRERHVDGRGPRLLELADDIFHEVDRLDEVRARALRDLDGDRRLAVDAGDRGRVLEGGADLGHVPQRHARAGGRGDGQLQHVLGPLDQAGDLDGEAAAAAFQRAGGHERIALRRGGDQFLQRDAVALQQHRLGDHLDDLVARATQLGGQHAGDLLDGVLGAAGDAQQRPLGHVAGQGHDEDGKERKVHLAHGGLVGVARQVALGVVHLGAHVGQRLGRD